MRDGDIRLHPIERRTNSRVETPCGVTSSRVLNGVESTEIATE